MSFGDRLRILLGGHIHTRVVTGTERLPGRTRNLETLGSVDWPKWWPFRRRLPAYEAEGRP